MTNEKHHTALNPEVSIRESGGRTWTVYHWAGSGKPTLFLHGFSRTGRDVEGMAHYRSEGASIFSVDLPGHSNAAAHEGDIWEWAQDLHQLVDQLTHRPVHLMGYSMGGRVAMRMAMLKPQRFSRLSLLSASPGLEGNREARRQWDAGIAAEARSLNAEAFAERWEALPILKGATDGEEPWASRLASRRRNQNGSGLASAMEAIGAGSVEPVWGQLPELTLPTDLLAGERDEKYVDIVHRMATMLPHSRTRLVEGAGHCLPIEAPALCARFTGL